MENNYVESVEHRFIPQIKTLKIRSTSIMLNFHSDPDEYPRLTFANVCFTHLQEVKNGNKRKVIFAAEKFSTIYGRKIELNVYCYILVNISIKDQLYPPRNNAPPGKQRFSN